MNILNVPNLNFKRFFHITIYFLMKNGNNIYYNSNQLFFRVKIFIFVFIMPRKLFNRKLIETKDFKK